MEELQATALGMLNTPFIGINDKINSLIEFKEEAVETLKNTSSNRSKKDLNDYIEWIDRQLDLLNRNGQHIIR